MAKLSPMITFFMKVLADVVALFASVGRQYDIDILQTDRLFEVYIMIVFLRLNCILIVAAGFVTVL